MLAYGDDRIPYVVVHDEARTTKLAIHVDPDGSVTVDAPHGYSDQQIRSAVQQRARWIVQNVLEAQERKRHRRPKEYTSGEQILYLGRRYMLKVVPVTAKPKPVKLIGNRLQVETQANDPEDIKGRVRAWYRVRGRDYLAGRLAVVAKDLPWLDRVPPFRLLDMSRQWGSCAPSGEIILNIHLIKAPRPCIDYVLVHELAHLKHHDHGPEFWKLVDTHSPNWRKVKTQLDNMVEVLTAE